MKLAVADKSVVKCVRAYLSERVRIASAIFASANAYQLGREG